MRQCSEASYSKLNYYYDKSFIVFGSLLFMEQHIIIVKIFLIAMIVHNTFDGRVNSHTGTEESIWKE